MATLDPWIPAACRANRAFLGRVVEYLAAEGIRQFLDIGSGIPASGNVHEVGQSGVPDARVVYVDRDPVAVAMGRKLLTGNDRTNFVQADIRDLDAILGDPAVGRLIDFGEPVAIMLVAILHFVLNAGKPSRLVQRLRDAAAPGSYLVLSHASSQDNEALAAAAERIYNSRAADGQARSREQIAGFFGDWELAEPGLVFSPQWRPGSPDDVPGSSPEKYWFLAGVAPQGSPVENVTAVLPAALRSGVELPRFPRGGVLLAGRLRRRRGLPPHHMFWPPSTISLWPVMNPASLESMSIT